MAERGDDLTSTGSLDPAGIGIYLRVMAKISKSIATSCAICGKPVVERFKPFCSGRCADVDLNRWLSGSYVIPGRELTEDDEGQQAAPVRKDDD
jgi:endogenous inhibitor of DNA gyrase (YacG/DUF329 family)